jgi:hypothetical protein
MRRRDEIELARWLAGQGDEAERRAFAARLDAEPDLAAAAAARRAAWEGLELPAPAAAPPGFAARLALRARAAGAPAMGTGLAPWLRPVAAAALLAGLAAGVGVGRWTAEESLPAQDVLAWSSESGLADGYLDALDVAASLSAEENP